MICIRNLYLSFVLLAVFVVMCCYTVVSGVGSVGNVRVTVGISSGYRGIGGYVVATRFRDWDYHA